MVDTPVKVETKETVPCVDLTCSDDEEEAPKASENRCISPSAASSSSSDSSVVACSSTTALGCVTTTTLSSRPSPGGSIVSGTVAGCAYGDGLFGGGGGSSTVTSSASSSVGVAAPYLSQIPPTTPYPPLQYARASPPIVDLTSNAENTMPAHYNSYQGHSAAAAAAAFYPFSMYAGLNPYSMFAPAVMPPPAHSTPALQSLMFSGLGADASSTTSPNAAQQSELENFMMMMGAFNMAGLYGNQSPLDYSRGVAGRAPQQHRHEPNHDHHLAPEDLSRPKVSTTPKVTSTKVKREPGI